jgi:endonuclease G
MLIDLEQLQESEKRFEYVGKERHRENQDTLSDEAFITELDPELIKGNLLSEVANLKKRKGMIEKEGKEPSNFAYERAIGINDSVYSNFVDLLSDAKKKVGRISCKRGIKEIGCATGFMVSQNLMLTNWHVFKTRESVENSEIQFFYELDRNGNRGGSIQFKLRPDQFYYSNKDLDYCFIAVEDKDVSAQHSLEQISYLFLDRGLGKIGTEEKECLNIVHHPNGDYKQLSIRENLFVRITPTTIWYECDTAPGSSGSPVFNDQWQVVALHHMGVGRKNEAGQYVDKNGEIIEPVGGKIDERKVVWLANEGIRISVILDDLFSRFENDTIVNSIKQKPVGYTATSTLSEISNTQQTLSTSKIMEQNNPDNNVTISFPSSLIGSNGNVTVHINNHGIGQTPAFPKAPAPEEIDVLEIKKLEETLDLSDCRGYQPMFLGTAVGFPKPRPKLSKFIARVEGTDGRELKYYHYSVLLHTVRMMPVISAINVDGDLGKRKDESKRKDVWLRDNRISYDVQLDDDFYKRSGFDRGHMSRREDANWGSSPEIAKRNADLTCMHTNACPQVGAINQSQKGGLWGNLEKVVLESGATQEKRKTAKISVFNGPIFKSTDPVYKGIQVPMEFYKIIFWLTDQGGLKATAFKLSQKDLVGDIDFEQLDLDQNVEFKEYQVSIKDLEEETQLDFSDVLQYDTFAGGAGEEIAITSARELMTHLDKVKANV